MKKLLSFLGLTLALILTACHDDKDYRDVMPNDAIMAVKVDLGTMLSKSEALQNPRVQDILLSGSNDLQRTFLNELLKNPENSGIDVAKPLLLALTDLDDLHGVMALAIKDKALFESFLKLTEVKIDNPEQFYYDAQQLVISLDGINPTAKNYLNLPAERKATADSRFEAFFGDPRDVSFYYDGGRLLASASQQQSAVAIDTTIYEGMTGLMGLNFDNGSISYKVKINHSEALKALSDQINLKANGSLLKHVPGNAFAVADFALRNLSSYLSIFSAEQREQFATILEVVGLTTDDLDAINGDITLAATSDLGLMAVMQCQDNRLIEAIVNVLRAELSVNTIAPGVYQSMGVIFGYADGKMFVMNRTLERQCLSQGKLVDLAQQSFASSRLATRLGDGGVVIEPSMILDVIHSKGFDNAPDAAFLLPLLSGLDNVNASTQLATNEAEINVEFTDKQQNALKQLLDILLVSLTEG